MVQLGIDTLLDQHVDRLAGQRLGLITNQSGTNSDFQHTINLLDNHGAIDLQKLFAPEHGVRGTVKGGEEIEDDIDEETGLPILSLYGYDMEDRHLQSQMIEDLDAVVYDMQDIGSRYYTVIYTLAFALEGVAEAGKKMYVLDRPNPIAPLDITGNRVPDEHASFIGGYQLPIIHGMTVGELARYVNGEFDIEANLEVIEMEGWEHDTWYTESDLSWVPPSSNMPTIQTAIIYPGTCCFEKTNISEGRGTTRPFELIGAPWIDADDWAAALEAEDLPGVRFRPAYFKPMFPSLNSEDTFGVRHEGENIEGVQVHIVDRDAIDPVRVGLTMLISAFSTFPECDCLQFDEHYVIDDLAGGTWLRKILDDLDATSVVSEIVDSVVAHWDDDCAEFSNIRQKYLLYQ